MRSLAIYVELQGCRMTYGILIHLLRNCLYYTLNHSGKTVNEKFNWSAICIVTTFYKTFSMMHLNELMLQPGASSPEKFDKFPFFSQYFSYVSHWEMQVGKLLGFASISKFSIFPTEECGENKSSIGNSGKSKKTNGKIWEVVRFPLGIPGKLKNPIGNLKKSRNSSKTKKNWSP